MPSQTLELLTDCMGTVKAAKDAADWGCPAELRIPSIRGQLRFWARAVLGGTREHKLFGGVNGAAHGLAAAHAVASRFSLSLKPRSVGHTEQSVAICPHKGGAKRPAIEHGSKFDLSWTLLRPPSLVAERERLEGDFQRVLKTWCLLGGLGARVNRAAGSVWPVGFAPSVGDFTKAVSPLLGNPSVRFAVLDKVTAEAIDLRKIASDTVISHSESLGSAKPRKASPLKLKVGRFSDGYRLIAVWDNRDMRGGNLAAGVADLCAGGKALGPLLKTAGM